MKKLSEITRTEVFYTSHLYYGCLNDSESFQTLLIKTLGLSRSVKIVDSGYEICLFRDLAKAGYIDRENKSFEKQTFDNVFVLSDESIVLIEAKANQKFSPSQINNMILAKEKIQSSNDLPWKKVHLLGLCSSKYKPKNTTIKDFDAVITWAEVAACLSDMRSIFERADNIYNDRALCR
ncbi:PD-(D/E)XK nuclease family protein [Vibrio neonatus]|uniref:PD-(D/E)XK nuclease family protein n=1 Tax=Vibrio neonatus TaxID=278860 RepID=UPI0021C3F856|nr:PD-(D/E)XK nuclease family protein [Vibrio neonatus]